MEYDIQLIGKRIKAARKAKRYTQDYVSAKVNIGEKFLSQIECGKAGLSVQTLIALCNVLEVSPNYLLLASFSGDSGHPLTKWLEDLTPQQLEDAETMLKLFAKNCK